MLDERTFTTQQEQRQRRRSDLEEALGERFWELLDDGAVREINIRPNGVVSYQRVGERSGKFFADFEVDAEDSEHIATAILQNTQGHVLNDDNQYVNCKLSLGDGDEFARVHIVGAQATADGGAGIMVRKHNPIAPTFEEWVERGFMTPQQYDAAVYTVTSKRNTLVCGKMFTGKSTWINSRYEMTHRLDPTRSVAFIQDVPETVCPLKDRMALMASRVTPYEKHCEEVFRQSVDEVTINELRTRAAYDLVHNIWLSGHEGGASSLHASSKPQAMWRIGTLIRLAGVELQPDVIAAAVHVLVIIRFNHRVGRRVTEIVEVTGHDGRDFTFKDLAPPVPWDHDDVVAPPPSAPRVP